MIPIILSLTLFFSQVHSALTNLTLAHSSLSSSIIFPSGAPLARLVTYPYSFNISQTPQAIWIWSGKGDSAACPMTITIEDQIKITCLVQPITFYAASDNQFDAQFLGNTVRGELSPKSTTVNPITKTCNQTYKFTITATNWVVPGKVNCGSGNWAGVIYGVVQKSICCENDNSFYNESTCLCDPCSSLFQGCATCNISACKTCSSVELIINNTQCICIQNNYAFNGLVCVQCHLLMTNCTNCSHSKICLQCQTGSKLNPTTHLCETCDLGCTSCNYSECFSCDNLLGFSLYNKSCICNQTSFVKVTSCQPCFLITPHCTKCHAVLGCLECEKGYHVSLGICSSICGDGVLILANGEDCDDGNNQNGDGCNEFCKVEQNYSCTSINQDISLCSYNQQFRVFVICVKKQYFKNRLSIILGVRPNISSLQILDFSKAISTNSSLSDSEFSYNLNGTVELIYNFHQTLESSSILLIFDPSSISKLFHSPSSNLTVQMITNSNIPISYYEQWQYEAAKLMQKMVILSIVLSNILIIVGLFFRRLIGLQNFLVIQVSFISLSSINKVQPIFSTILPMGFVSGYNWIPSKDNRLVPDRVNAIGYSNNYQDNMNFMLILLCLSGIVIPVAAYLFSLILSKYSKIFHKIYQISIGRISLVLALYETLNIGFSLGIHLLYGQNSSRNWLLIFLSLVLTLSSIVGMLWFESTNFGDFFNFLKASPQDQLYFKLNLLNRFVLGLTLGLFNYSTYVAIYALFASIFFIVFQISTLPHRKSYENYHSILCWLCVIVILGVRMFYRSMKQGYPIVQISRILQTGFIEVVLMVVCVFGGLSCLIYEIKSQIWGRKNVQKQRIIVLRRKSNNQTSQKTQMKETPSLKN